VGERDRFGGAQLTLIPLLLLGITWVSLHFRSSRGLMMLLIAGLAFDFALGVLLQARVEHLENTADRTVFTGLGINNGSLDIGVPGEYSLTPAAWGNWYRKHQLAASEKWLRDLESFRPGDPALELSKKELRENLQRTVAEDVSLWKGWYRRHGGEMTFLGDHFGDSDVAAGLLVAVAALLLWRVARIPVLPVVVLAPAAKARPRKR